MLRTKDLMFKKQLAKKLVDRYAMSELKMINSIYFNFFYTFILFFIYFYFESQG